jgi:hypothetical protein
MTLIGAFKTIDGAVLFADGQETIPNYAKFEVEKLYYFEMQGLFRVLMTAAGPSDGIEMLWARVSARLKKDSEASVTMDGAKHMTVTAVGPSVQIGEVESTIVNTVADFTKECILPWPEGSRPYVAAIWIIQRLCDEQVPGWKGLYPIRVFHTEELWANPVERHYFTGSAVLLARYIADSYLSKLLLTTDEAEALAAFILWEAKSYDTDCGKQSDIIVVKDGGEIRWVLRQEVAYWEEHFALYKKLQQLMPLISCAEEQVKRFYGAEEHIDRFAEGIRFLAEEQRKMRNCHGAFQASLEGRLINELAKQKAERGRVKENPIEESQAQEKR